MSDVDKSTPKCGPYGPGCGPFGPYYGPGCGPFGPYYGPGCGPYSPYYGPGCGPFGPYCGPVEKPVQEAQYGYSSLGYGFSTVFLIVLLLLCFPFFCGGGFY